MTNTMVKKNRRGLSRKLIGILIIFAIILTVSIIFESREIYRNNTIERYNTEAYQIASTAASQISETELMSYVSMIDEFKNESIDMAELDEYAKNNENHALIQAKFDAVRSNMDVNEVALVYINPDDLLAYDADAAAKEAENAAAEGRSIIEVMVYLFDSYRTPEDQFSLGQSWGLQQKYVDALERALRDGTNPVEKFLTSGTFGETVTAVHPVLVTGNGTVCTFVELPMSTLKKDIQSFVVTIIIVAVLVTLLILVIAIWYVINKVLKPISLVTREADAFVETSQADEESVAELLVSEHLSTIKTNDEIQSLSESILSMEKGINKYIADVTKVTAEKERIGAELNVATQIQADMLPSIFPPFPERTEFDIYASMKPAKEVGGDFYDFYMIDQDHLALTIADVSGKGVPAALFMVISKTLLKNAAYQGLSPQDILTTVNGQLVENNNADMFVTVWIGIMQISTGHVVAANAGHEYPTLRSAEGMFEIYKDKHGMPLGVIEGAKYKEYEFDIEAGGTLYVYTDGVPEATNTTDELLGIDRMLEALNGEPDAKPEKLLHNVKNAIDEFVGSADPFDDITMLSIKRA